MHDLNRLATAHSLTIGLPDGSRVIIPGLLGASIANVREWAASQVKGSKVAVHRVGDVRTPITARQVIKLLARSARG